MRICISILIVMLVVFMSSCSDKSIVPVSPEVTVAEPVEAAMPTFSETEPPPAPKPDRQPYMEQYGAQHCFEDVFFPEKCWLICEETIVQLISFEGFDDVTVIDRASVERVQSLSLGNCVSIEAFDRTNQTVSIMVSPQEADTMLVILS